MQGSNATKNKTVTGGESKREKRNIIMERKQ